MLLIAGWAAAMHSHNDPSLDATGKLTIMYGIRVSVIWSGPSERKN